MRALPKLGDLILWICSREEDSPMSGRDLSQPSLVDALASGYGRAGFVDRIKQAFDRSAFEPLRASLHASARGALGFHHSRLGEGLIQGGEVGLFRRPDLGQPGSARDPRASRPRRWDRLEGEASPLSARGLAKIRRRLGGQHPLRRRARLRHDEALARNGPASALGGSHSSTRPKRIQPRSAPT